MNTKSSKIRTSKTKSRQPFRSADVPVTAQMLYGVRDELIKRMDSQFHSLKSEIHGFKSEIHGIKSEMHGLKSEIHRLALLVEEQNARNVFVLDGLTGLFDRQERLEKEVSQRS